MFWHNLVPVTKYRLYAFLETSIEYQGANCSVNASEQSPGEKPAKKGVFMQEKNYVSLWLGTSKSKKSLDKYIKIKYTRDGDFVPSIFARDFKIERYDDDFREAKFYDEKSNNIHELLDGFSYSDVVVEYFKNEIGEELAVPYNSVILLYNFNYDGMVEEIKNGTEYFKFIGVTKYR